MPRFGIIIPKSTDWPPKAATALIRSILQDKRVGSNTVIFNICAHAKGIDFQIAFDQNDIDASFLQALVRAFYPEAEVYVPPLPELFYPLYQHYILFDRNTALYYQRGITADQITSPDPLALLTQAASNLLPGERLDYDITRYSTVTFTEKEIKQKLTQSWAEAGLQSNVSYNHDSFSDAFAAGIVGGIFDSIKRTNRFSPREEEWYRNKLSQPVYSMWVSLSFTTPDPGRLQLFTAARSIVRTILPTDDASGTTVTIHAAEEYIRFTPYIIFWNRYDDYRQEKNKKKREEKWKNIESKLFYWIPEEIAAVWHLPHKEFTEQSIHWLKGRQVRLPPQLQERRHGTLVGHNEYSGNRAPVRLLDAERLTHIHVLGKTGTGKTTLLHRLIDQDIAAGNGIALIDPQGKLVQHILSTSIPKERENDVVVIDLANELYPPPLNLLALPTGADQNTASGRIMAMLEKHGSFSDTVTVAPTLRAALVTLWQEKTPTVRDVVRVFTNEQYRHRLLSGVDNPVVDDFWEMFEAKSAGQREQLMSPVITRMTDLYGNPYLYPSICHPKTLDFASLMEQRKIILVSLGVDKGKIPDIDRYLLGSMLLFQLQIAAMNGASKTHPFYLYIDEVHQFITSPLSRMLSEVRQHNLSITLAHQYLDQLEGETLEAVIGTVGTMLVFQCGIDDARALAPYMKPNFAADDLISLDLYNAVVHMRFGSQTLPAFNIKTEPPFTTQDTIAGQARERYLRELSIQRYTPMSRETVLSWLRDRYKRPVTLSDDEQLVDPTS